MSSCFRLLSNSVSLVCEKAEQRRSLDLTSIFGFCFDVVSGFSAGDWGKKEEYEDL